MPAIGSRSSVIALVSSLGLATATAFGQAHEPKPDAVAALKKVVEAYRAKPGITINSNVSIELEQDGATSEGGKVELKGTYGQGRRAVITLRDFTCHLEPGGGPDEPGTLSVINAQTPHSYFRVSDDGSPYYTLLNAFLDIPFPELAIMLGEDSMENLVMQLHPKAPWLQPTAVRSETIDGKAMQHIRLTSDYEDMDIIVDPATNLIQHIDLTVMGGDFVQRGAKLMYHHEYEYPEVKEEEAKAAFAFDPGARQRVDTMTALVPRRVAPEGDEEEGDGGAIAAGALVGKPAPAMVLSTLDGKAVDLEDLRGKVVILDFWATWCPPCRAALPELHKVDQWAREEHLEVEIFAVNVFESRGDENTPDARNKSVGEFWKKNEFTLPVAMDYSDEVARSYGVNGIPATFVIGPDGMVRSQHEGFSGNYAEALKREILEALKPVGENPKPNLDEEGKSGDERGRQ